MSNWSPPQSGSGPTTRGATSSAVTISGTIAAGSRLLASVVTSDATGTHPTVSDDHGSTYALADAAVNATGNINTSVSCYLFAATVPTTVTGLVVTSHVPSTSSGLAVDVFPPVPGATNALLTHANATPNGKDMAVGPLSWTSGILGLDFGVAVSGGYDEGTATPAVGYTIASTFEGGGPTGEVPGFHTFYRLNDTSGSATPEVTFQNGTFGGIVGAIFGASDTTNQLYLGAPSIGVVGHPTGAFTARIGAVSGSNVTVHLSSDVGGDTFSATPGGSAVTSVPIPAGSAQAIFYLTPSGPGTHNISVTASGYATNGSPAALGVLAIAPGSLALTGRCLLAQSAGSLDFFANRTAATITFRFRVDSTAGITQGATTVIGWGTSHNGTPLAAWHPATQRLVIAAWSANDPSDGNQPHQFATSIPIQLGIDYHFLLSWGATPTLSLNGELHATAGFSNLATHPSYSGIAVGGDAGAGIALGHHVADLSGWSSHAATAGEARSLATAFLTPLDVATAALWWPLGSGTTGGHPGLSDAGLTDYTGNGNTLSLASGSSLSNATYDVPLALDWPAVITGQLLNSRRTIAIRAEAANGGIAPIAAFAANPTVRRDGTPVSVAWAWFSGSLDMPEVFGQLRCGAVDRIAIDDGGAGYTIASVAWNGDGGGTSLVLGTPVIKTGVTGYTFTGGNYYGSAPSVSVGTPAGWNVGATSPIGAAATATVSGGRVTAIAPAAGGLLGCGEGCDPANLPAVTLSGGFGGGATFTVVLSGGAIASAAVTAGGGGYPASTTIPLVVTDSTGSGATGTCTTNASGVVVSASVSGGSSYTAPTIAPEQVPATATAIVSTYIASVPVVSSSSDFTGPPTFAIAGGHARTASFLPIMTGAGPFDLLSYDSAANWITPTVGGLPLGGIRAVSGASISPEPAGPAPTLIAGANVGEQPVYPEFTNFTAKNRYHQGNGWSAQDTTLTFARDGQIFTQVNPGSDGNHPLAQGTPISWTNPGGTILTRFLYGPTFSNHLDGMGWPGQLGQWALRYDDPNVNGTAAMAMWIDGGDNLRLINGSGPNVGTTAGIVVDPRDIVLSGESIGSIALAHTTVGTGWQGAIILIAGGGGRDAAVVPIIGGGVLTGLAVICGGDSFTGTPTVTIYGTAVSGIATTAVFDLEVNPQTTTVWTPFVNLHAASTAGTWTASNVWVVAPDALTRLAVASIDPSQPLATDDSVIAALTGPSGRSVGVLRFMDVAQGYAGHSNYVWPSDLIDPTATDWPAQRFLNTYARYARYYNTDPAKSSSGDNTYPWPASTKVYGGQGVCTQTDAPFTITGTLTSGSKTVNGLSSNALMVGSTVSGAGIPSGTTIATIAADGSTFMLWPSAATASGSQTLTVTNPPYFTPRAAGAGAYMAYGPDNTGYQAAAIELRFEQPHGLSTGQLWSVFSASSLMAIPLTNCADPFSPVDGGNGGLGWVTGPFTVAFPAYVAPILNLGVPQTNTQQAVASTAEIDLIGLDPSGSGWQVYCFVPSGSFCASYQYTLSMSAQLPGSIHWLNIPTTASRALAGYLGTLAATILGPTNQVYLEYGNELWNQGANPDYQWSSSVAAILGDVPANTTILGRYVSDGRIPPFPIYGAAVPFAADLVDAFKAAWVAAGRDASQVHFVMGSFWASNGTHWGILETAQRWGIPLDFVAAAPYLSMPGDGPIVQAFAPAGSMAGAGSWTTDAINEVFRHRMIFGGDNQGAFSGLALACRAFGQPIRPLGLTQIANGLGSLAGGTYNACYTFADSLGRETTRGNGGCTPTLVAINAGDTLGLEMPGWPTWAASMPIYLTEGDVGSETFYLSIPRSDYGTTWPVGQPIHLTAPFTAGGDAPPTVNAAAPNTPTLPTPVAYEGAVQAPVPGSVPCWVQVMHDTFASPAFRDTTGGLLAACQLGGMTLFCFYQAWNGVDYTGWALAYGTAQPAGDGLSWAYEGSTRSAVSANRFATIQGGLPADGHDHNGGLSGNTAPGFLGLRDWFDGSSPTPTPTPTSTRVRRWFSALGQGAMRAGR